MRKHLSVFMLMVRSSIYRVLLVMLAMAAAEVGLIMLFDNPHSALLFDLIDDSRIYLVYVVAVALTMVCLFSACSFGSAKPRYTLARLSISEKAVMFYHWLAAALIMLMLWFWQIILLYALAIWHSGVADAGFISHQSIYLANFRSAFFHSVLPLEDMSRLVRNIVMAVCMGGVCASSAFKIRRGKKAIFAPLLLIAIFSVAYRAEHFETSYDGFMIFAFAFVLVISMIGVYVGDEEVDYEEAQLES